MKKFRFLHIFTLLFVLLALVSCDGGSIAVCPPWESFSQATDTPPTTQTTTSPPDATTAPETQPSAPKKRVAITFDDGPSRQGLTEKLVDEFAKYGGKATFFVLGNLISSSTGEALAYADAHGFEFGIHAYTHELFFDSCTEEEFLNELAMTKEALERYINSPVSLLRTPGGAITKERALLSGYPIIHWSIDTEDWRYKSRADDATIAANIDAIVANALSGIRDGDILLMHEIYTNSYEATCIILQKLDAMGFEFVTVSELIGSENLEVGKIYYSAP